MISFQCIKKKRPFIVEIASNDGTLLSNFSGKDAKILGIEPSVNIAKIANDKGIPTLNDFFSNKIAKKVVSTHGMANIIVGTNVLAHVPGIRDFVLAVKELLSKEGFAVFEFPYLLDLIEKVEFDTIYHEHIFYLSISPLSALFNEAGMEIFEVKKTDVHGGSIQIYIQHKNGPHKLTSSTKKFIQLEKEKGLLEEKTYLSFASKVKSLRSSIYDLLNKIKSKGRTIAAYGAAAKGNILLNYCGIEPDIIDYVVDKSPLKVGKFTPGKRFPVLPVETLKKRTPEYLLILPWNLSNEIMTQEAWFAKTGGKFIVPIPEIKCIGNQIDR